MNKSSNDLFDLIMSLGKGEKIFFRNYIKSTLPGKSNYYIKLFDLVQRSKNPDEKTIKKQLGAKNYSKIKWYLYESLLECLRLYFKENSDNAISFHNQALSAVILRKKSLNMQSLVLLDKMKESALAEENFVHLQETLLIIAEQLRNPIQLELLDKNNQDWLSLALDAVEKSKNYFQYTDLLNKLLHFIRSKGESLRDQRELDEITRIMDNPLLTDENKAITVTTKMSFFLINSILSFVKGNFRGAFYHASRQADLLLENPLPREKARPSYHVFYNAGMYATYISEWKEAEKYFNLLKKMNTPSRLAYYLQLQYSINLGLYIYNRKGEYEKALLLIREKEGEIKRNAHRMDLVSNNVLFSNISESYFLSGNYKKALEWIKPVLYEKKFNPTEEILVHGKLYLMALYFEMKDMHSLNQLQESFYRSMSNKDKLFEFEKTMISFFRKLVKLTEKDEKITLFKKLHRQLIELTEKPVNYISIEVQFDYITWLESKIKGVKFGDLLQEKVQSGKKAFKF